MVTESPPPHTRAPDDKPPARTSNSARTALLKVRISRRWYDSRPSSLRCCRSSTSARRRWPKASARQIPSELDDQHPPSREDRPSDVLADLWYQKAPIDARDDVQSTVVRLDVAPCHCLSCSARALVPCSGSHDGSDGRPDNLIDGSHQSARAWRTLSSPQLLSERDDSRCRCENLTSVKSVDVRHARCASDRASGGSGRSARSAPSLPSIEARRQT